MKVVELWQNISVEPSFWDKFKRPYIPAAERSSRSHQPVAQGWAASGRSRGGD